MADKRKLEVLEYLLSKEYEFWMNKDDSRIHFQMSDESLEDVEEYEIKCVECHYLCSKYIEIYFIVAEEVPEEKRTEILKAVNYLNTIFHETCVVVDHDSGKVAIRLLVNSSESDITLGNIDVCIKRRLPFILGAKVILEGILIEDKDALTAIDDIFSRDDMSLQGLSFAYWNSDHKLDETVLKILG